MPANDTSLREIAATIAEDADGILHSTEYDNLFKQIVEHPVLGKAPKPLVRRAVELALERHRGGYLTLEESEHEPYRAAFAADGIHSVQRAYDDILTNEASVSSAPSSKVETKSITWARQLTNQWNKLSTSGKVQTGMSFAMAGLLGLVALNHLQEGLTHRDEAGTHHIEYSRVGLGFVEALLAAGSAYLGATCFKGVHAR